ncbi:MOSC domain-containing protein [Micropruina sp.]|uniref:MOSC domain-containing protein n=1 Tax=Micropruina sp. TaxID=2737536 RepID=UPI0039E4461C
MTASVLSVNLGRPALDRGKPENTTGIDKQPVASAAVRAPGARDRTRTLGPDRRSGLAGDYIGDGKNHGGDVQAVYACAREDLDALGAQVGRQFISGSFGENLTTQGLDVNGALIGERWRIGTGPDAVELRVTCPRIPCNTFRAFIAERGWLKTFTRAAKPGAYLSVVTPGVVRAADPVEVVFRPDHAVTIEVLFRSQTLERELAPLVLTAADYLDAESLDYARRGATFTIG